jgi:hypothetical protein
VCLLLNYWYFTVNIYFDVQLLCINHICWLYMPSWGPDLVNKLISFSISISVYYYLFLIVHWLMIDHCLQGRIQDFKLGGGGWGGGARNKIFCNCGGRHEHFWGISCEKSRFYAKKSYFFQLRREARTFLGYFVWKITILHQKIIFFPILGETRTVCAPPPGSAPGWVFILIKITYLLTTYGTG